MKLSIAVVLSHDSKLLILDEATSELDPVVRNEILDIFRELIEDEEHTVFLSSHITSDIEKIADYVMLIHKGQLLFMENKDEIIYKYGIVKCAKEQAAMIPKELIVGKEENEFGASVLVNDREQVMEASFMRNNVGTNTPVIDRAGIEDVLLYTVKQAVFKLGVEKGRYVYMTVMVVFAFVIIGGLHFFDFAQRAVDKIEEIPEGVLAAASACISLVLLAVSYLVSVKLVEKKEW